MARTGPKPSWWPYLPLLGAVAAVGLLVLIVLNGLEQHRTTVAEGIRARLNQRVVAEMDRFREAQDRRSARDFAGQTPAHLFVALAAVVTDGTVVKVPPPTGDALVEPAVAAAALSWCTDRADWIRDLAFPDGAVAWEDGGWRHWPFRLVLGPDERPVLVRRVDSPTGAREHQVIVGYAAGLQAVADAAAAELSPAIAARWLRSANRPLAFAFDLPPAVVEANTPTGDLRRLLVLGVALCLAAIAAGALVLRRARRQLIREQTFTAAVSHELKTPVAAMQALANNLAEGLVEDPARRAEYHRLLSREAARLGHLVDNVLAQTRLEHGHLKLRPRPGLLNRVCREVAQELVDQDISLDLDELADVVPVDEDALKRILINLVDNARKYAPGSPIAISTAGVGKDAVLRVADRGPGIPDATKVQVLERWQRVPGHDHQPGLGLGLSLVATLVEAHGGSLALVDNEPQGLVVELRFPLALERYLLG